MCNLCGNAVHVAWRCTVDQSEYKNVVDIVLPNSSDENQESVVNVVESTTDMDIHINPSQGSKPLEFILCDYTCKYDHILSEHMETHSDEKPLERTDCKYKCQNDDVLHNHLKSHDIYACFTIHYVKLILISFMVTS